MDLDPDRNQSQNLKVSSLGLVQCKAYVTSITWYSPVQVQPLMIDKHDSLIFRSVRYPDHCLHHLLPAKRNYSMKLRPRGYDYNYTLSAIYIQSTLKMYLHIYSVTGKKCPYNFCQKQLLILTDYKNILQTKLADYYFFVQ